MDKKRPDKSFKQSKWTKWWKGLVVIFILILPFIVFYWQCPFWSNRTIGNDYVDCWIHEQMELQYSLKKGSFPLYVPGFAGGQTSSALTLGQMYHPVSHLSAMMPGYWQGKAIYWNTFWRLLLLGLAQLVLYFLLCKIGIKEMFAFIISFVTVYNFRMLDLFRHGAALENYTGYLFLCAAFAFYYIKPTRFWGPLSIVVSTYLLICGGHPQMMYLGLLGAGLALLFIPFILGSISFRLKADKSRLLKYFSSTVIFFFSGILLASAYTIPFYFDFLRSNALRIGHKYQWSLLFTDSLKGSLNSFFSPWNSDIHGAFGSSTLIILIITIPLLFLLRRKVPVAVMSLWGILLIIFLGLLGNSTQVHYFFWKYFPLAQTFRVPGRIALLFPFLFLLMLAWLFRGAQSGKKQVEKDPGKERIKSLLSVFFAIPLFILYHWILARLLSKPGPFTPASINRHPKGMEWAVFWIGLSTLILVAIYALLVLVLNNSPKKQFWLRSLGILLAITVVSQVVLEFRYGIWMVRCPRGITLVKMEKQKKRRLISYREACYGLESKTVVDQMRRSILEPALAKFYRKYKIFPNRKKVYRFLSKENATQTLAVEDAQHRLEDIEHKKEEVTGEDVVLLEFSSYNRVVFSLEAQSPGFFTFSAPYSGHWKAFVDGKPANLFRANGHMHAVFIDEGQKRIEFRYWSLAAFWGMLVSCLIFCFLGLYFIFVLSKKRKQQLTILLIFLVIPVLLFWGWYNNLYNGDNLGTQYSWTTEDFPPENNSAYAKRTRMSSGGQSFHASRGVDGRITRPPFKTPPYKKGWWQVDLGSPKLINEIIIYDGSFQGRKHLPLKIYGSNSGKNFDLLKEVKKRGKEYPWIIRVKGESIRFLRIQSPVNIPMTFNEVMIFASTPLTQGNK